MTSRIVGRQPSGSWASTRVTVSRGVPSQPQRRHHWSGSRTRHARTARPGSRRWPGDDEAELVESAEGGQIGVGERVRAVAGGSVGHVEVFQMASVRTSISREDLDVYPGTATPAVATPSSGMSRFTVPVLERNTGAACSKRSARRGPSSIHLASPNICATNRSNSMTSRATMIDALELFMKEDVQKRLENKYGADWFKSGVPRNLRVEAGKMMIERNRRPGTGPRDQRVGLPLHCQLSRRDDPYSGSVARVVRKALHAPW